MKFDLQHQLNIIAVLIFTIIGFFGNFQLLWIFKRKKELRTKSSLLLGINAVIHLICLASQWVNIVFIQFFSPFTRAQCYPFIMHFIFVVTIQCFITLIMAIEVCCLLMFPIRLMHMSLRKFSFISFLFLIPSSIFCIWICYKGWIDTDNTVIPFCNTILSQTDENRSLWTLVNNVTNCATVLVYGVALLYFKHNGVSNVYIQKRVIRHMSIIVLFFVCSYFAAQALVFLTSLIDTTETAKMYLQSIAIFPALLCYSQNFYLCIWRSGEFRNSFKEQIEIMSFGLWKWNKTGIITSISRRTPNHSVSQKL